MKLFGLFIFGILTACQPGLSRQPKVKAFSVQGIRTPPAGTVSQESGVPAPPALTLEKLHQGRRAYEIHCSVCHGYAGDGDGMAGQRGFPPPPSLFENELMKKSPDHFFKIISEGQGKMFGAADRISAENRWAIAYYVRALQVSRNFPKDKGATAQ